MIDNSLSDRYTVIEVSGLDRPGLLYELTSALSKLNLEYCFSSYRNIWRESS